MVEPELMQSRCSWRLGVLAVDVVGVVGRQQRDPQVLGEPEQAVADPASRCRARGPSARGSSCPGRGCPGSPRRPGGRRRSCRSRRWTCTSPDGQPVVPMMPVPCWASSSRSMRGCLKKPSRHAPVESRNRLCMPSVDSREQRHVGVGAARGDVVGAAVVEVDALALEAGDVGREVGLDADDRLDPGGLGLLVELVGAEHVAVVGHRDRRHAQLGGALGQRRRAAPRRRAWSTRCGRAGGRRM